MTHPFRIVTTTLLAAAFLGGCTGASPSADRSTPDAETRVYHVQLQLTEDKDHAEAILSRGLRWWTNQPSSSRPPIAPDTPSSDTAVSIEWKAPFYRVRVGPFATEQQAQLVLEKARSAFPDAFIAPDRIQNP